MCCHTPVKRIAAPLALLLAAAALAPAAGAAATPTGTAGGATRQVGMKIVFSGRFARVAGPGAPVSVKCTGSVSRSCDGTLSLLVGGESSEVPFTVARGETRTVVVPLWRAGSLSALAVAETVQPSGGVVRSKHSFRLR